MRSDRACLEPKDQRRAAGKYAENRQSLSIAGNFMKKALVCWTGGFIGGHLMMRLKRDGFWVRGVDLKIDNYVESHADDFVVADLREQSLCRGLVNTRFDEEYQLAVDMGALGWR